MDGLDRTVIYIVLGIVAFLVVSELFGMLGFLGALFKSDKRR